MLYTDGLYNKGLVQERNGLLPMPRELRTVYPSVALEVRTRTGFPI